jgi:8-oxo-dGTP diphosphatase
MPAVPRLTSTFLIEAATPAVAGALREHSLGTPAGGYAEPGREAAEQVRLAPGLRITVRWRLSEVAPHRVRRVQDLPMGIVHTSELAPTRTGTRLTETVEWTAPTTTGLLSRPLVRAAIRRRAGRLRARAEHLDTAPVVVAAAVLRDGRVLAQQRARPAELAGRWELPGGRVEPGESAPEALVRECREELAVQVLPGARLGPDVPLPGGLVLRVHTARLADPQARPEAVEHAGLRWVDAAELRALDWLDADRAVLPDLERTLADHADRA